MTKFKAPQGFQAACNLLAKLPTQALLLGPDATRKYSTHQGPWDADHFDRAAQSLLTLVDSGKMEADEARQLRLNLSAVYWAVGQRDAAERMTAALIDDPVCEAGIRNTAARQLGEIRAGRTPFGTKASKTKVVVAEAARTGATLAPMLDSDWVPYFTSPIAGLADALDEGTDLPAAAGTGPLRLAVFANEDFPPIPPADVGRSGRYLILSRAAERLMSAYVPDAAHRRALHIEGHGDYCLIDLPAHDCLVEARSSVRRARSSGRLIVQRGLFDPTRIAERRLFRPLGSHEIFVAPAFARELKQICKDAGFKGVRIRDDVMARG